MKSECTCDIKYRQSVCLSSGRQYSFFIVTICNRCGKTIFKKRFLNSGIDDKYLKEVEVV